MTLGTFFFFNQKAHVRLWIDTNSLTSIHYPNLLGRFHPIFTLRIYFLFKMGGEKPPTSFSSFQENGGFVQFPDEAPQPSFFDG